MAETQDLVTFLTKVPLFEGLNSYQLKQIASRLVHRTYQAGQEIVTQGKSGFGMFVVSSGRAEAVVEYSDGSKTIVNAFGPSDFFGEVTMLDGGPRTASVIARETTECLVLGRIDFLTLMHNDAEIASEIAVALAKRLRRAVETC
ncbi:MAG: cyclic nucleotide-binding domain-containing protein [Anaerolineae bacterium]|nr:cyclic nucleotide-binding domain-containing protein [Anaerolineae bacterium]